MADYVFKKNDAGIRKLLQSNESLKVMETFARKKYGDAYMKSFIGFDRAKVFVEEKTK